MVHPDAAKGFARGARDYEAGRPSYPKEAIDAIVSEYAIGPSTVVVDVGAGTGKFTRLLTATQAELLAVEPVAEMREVFAETVPGVPIVDGTGEAIPVDDASVDVLTAAQVFHWVDGARGVAEIERVLKPGAGIAFIWNRRDTTVAWPKAIERLMDSVAGDAPRYASEPGRGWRDVMEADGRFGEMRRLEFRLDHPTSLEATLARVASTSYVSALPDDERAGILDEVRAIVAGAGLGTEFTEPYITEVFLCRKK